MSTRAYVLASPEPGRWRVSLFNVLLWFLQIENSPPTWRKKTCATLDARGTSKLRQLRKLQEPHTGPVQGYKHRETLLEGDSLRTHLPTSSAGVPTWAEPAIVIEDVKGRAQLHTIPFEVTLPVT